MFPFYKYVALKTGRRHVWSDRFLMRLCMSARKTSPSNHQWQGASLTESPTGGVPSFITNSVLRPRLPQAALSQWLSPPGVRRQTHPRRRGALPTGHFDLKPFPPTSCSPPAPPPRTPPSFPETGLRSKTLSVQLSSLPAGRPASRFCCLPASSHVLFEVGP